MLTVHTIYLQPNKAVITGSPVRNTRPCVAEYYTELNSCKHNPAHTKHEHVKVAISSRATNNNKLITDKTLKKVLFSRLIDELLVL